MVRGQQFTMILEGKAVSGTVLCTTQRLNGIFLVLFENKEGLFLCELKRDPKLKELPPLKWEDARRK